MNEKTEWQALTSAPKDGTEILVRYPLQNNVKKLVNWDKIHGYWVSKGLPVLGLENQRAEWHPLPPDCAASPSSKSTKEAPELPKLPEPVAYRVTWDDGAGWRQYHDKLDPLPTEWDCEPPDEVCALYTGDQVYDCVNDALTSSSTKEDGGGLTTDQRYWLDRRAAIIEALAAEGLEIWSDKDRVWLHRSSPPSPLGDTPEQQEQKR